MVAPIALGLVCKFVFANYEHIELHLKKDRIHCYGTAMAAALNLALNWIFIPRYGFCSGRVHHLLQLLCADDRSLFYNHKDHENQAVSQPVYVSVSGRRAPAREALSACIQTRRRPVRFLRHF